MLQTLPVESAAAEVAAAQQRIRAALDGHAVETLGDSVAPDPYLAEIKALTVLLLHLAIQPGGDKLSPWADAARADHARSAGYRGARWGLAPPADLRLRGHAMAAADQILSESTLDGAADALHPWTELAPRDNEGQLGWLADHTTMTPTLTRLVMAATARRRRLATLLGTPPLHPLPLTAIPQVIPADVYNRHVSTMLDVTDRTGRLFGALCLARQHLRTASWAEAAHALGLNPQVGTKTARACSADLHATASEFIAALARVANDFDPTIDYRDREDAVRRLARSRGWYRPWARIHLPGSHATSQKYAVTWLWTEHAHGHIATSPSWQHPPDRHDRAHYRAYTDRLDHAATEALTALMHRRTGARRTA